VPNTVTRTASTTLIRGGLLKSAIKSLVFILWYEFLLQFRGYFPASRPACCFPPAFRISTLYYPFEHRLVFLYFKMIASTATIPRLENTPAQIAEARALPPMGRGKPSPTRAAYQNPPHTYPRIPRPVLRQGNTVKATFDSQFQGNASHVQRPLSLVSVSFPPRTSSVFIDTVSEHKPEAEFSGTLRSVQPSSRGRNVGTTVPIAQTSLIPRSSSYEQFKSSENIPNLPTQDSPHKRSRRRSPPTDSEDEDPFHFDTILSSTPAKKDDIPRKAISSSLYRHASIVPVDPSAAPAPHRFSLLREHASEGTIFVQEICDPEGRRWSLRVPASGLPDDMVSMLEELEKLALELGQALPRIVVTCSAESLSSKKAALTVPVAESAELLHPPPTTVNAIGGGYSLAKEKCRLVEPEPMPICEPEPAKFTASSSPVILSSPSEQSLTCIYLPEVSPRRPAVPAFAI
jgi:hypothetical protein